MDINEIVPYERNARHNEKAIPIVAESIREFGLKGQIVLESRENPVIVAGHTRWAACKLLGWTEIPDERIDYCDDLTEEQIKAYRLADNRTGEVATWNRALLKSEVKGLKTVDMSRFSFDFKSRHRPYGAERLRTDYYYNLDIVNIDDCGGEEGYPVLRASDAAPRDMIPFNFCKTATDFDVGVHFCIDDYQFERVWNRPRDYIELLGRFDCVVCPDFSVYMDMPLPMKRWNVYRSRALGNWWQRNGITVIPNVTYSGPDSYDVCLDGLPTGGTVFLSTVGVTKNPEWRSLCLQGMGVAMERVRPERLLLLGDDLGFDFKCEVVRYRPKAFRE